MLYTIAIEAPAYGEPEADAEKLLASLPGEDEPESDADPVPDLITATGYDEDARMVRATFRFEADDALDAHENGLDLWNTGWQDAFEGLAPPSSIAIKITPVEVAA